MELKNEPAVQQPKKSKKAEKALVLIALLLLLFATGSLYFDDWLWSGLRSRTDAIGVITSRTGDVRLKFDQEVSWQKATQGQPLQYNDSIFAGNESQADLKLGESQLTVTQNSLVVLRREMDANFLNLNFGTLFGKVAKGEKVFIDTGVGKPTLLKTTSGAQIVLKKTGNKTSLEVVKGVAEIEVDGKKTRVRENTALELPSVGEGRIVKQKLDIRVLPPSPMDTIYSVEPQSLTFKWSYGNEDRDLSQDRFAVEFSKESSFGSVFRKSVSGSDELKMNVAQSNQLYYRVRGPNGELSATHRFGFVRMLPPKLMTPTPDQNFVTAYRKSHEVDFKFHRPRLKPKVWAQIAGDEEFKTILVNESLEEDQWKKALPAGQYFVRAKSDFGNERVSQWSPVSTFKISEKLPILKAPPVALEQEVIIQNQAYPPHLYGASDSETQEYLYEKGFLRDHFSALSEFYDQMSLDMGNGQILNIQDAALPKDKIYPSQLKYRYQLKKAGRLPSSWSAPEILKITLEPPKENLVEVVEGQISNAKQVPVRIEFTPLLFAKSYEFQVASNPNYLKAKTFNGVNNYRNVKLNLNTDYYWRVRALDAQGKPLSAYSGSRKLSSKELANQVRLVQQRQKAVERKLAAADNASSESRADLQNMTHDYQQPHKFWAWLGSGFSYVNYKQNISDRGELDSQSRNDRPGQYFEVGYVGDTGYGGVLGYKSTPGEVIVTNATLDKTEYIWRTISLEGLLLKRAKFTLFGLPLNYGPRIGIQSHNVPYIFLNASDNLELKENEMMTASAGLMGEVPTGRWRFHSYMRYQFPISASSGGASDFELKPKFAFDGLLGTSYYFTHNFKVGAFWYGQWHFYDFVYTDPSITNSGSQSLFYSTMDLRLGFEF